MGHISIRGYEPRHLSYSTISAYRMCGAKFFFQKVLQLEERPGLAALGGNAIHAATEQVDRLILEHGIEILDAPASAAVDTRSEVVATRDETGF